MTTGLRTHRLLSVRVHNAPYDNMLAAAIEAAASVSPAYTTYSHFQILLDARARHWLRTLLDDAALNVADGIAVRAALRLRGAAPLSPVNATDFHHRLLDHLLASGKRVYLLGGSAAAAAALPERLVARFPNCLLRAHDGLISVNDDALLEDIRAFSPDVLILGLGSPLQFEWIARNLDSAAVPLTVATGNFLEFVAGTQSRAPQWMRAVGLEWLHRLVTNPTRLWRRYLIGIPRFLFHAILSPERK